MILLWVVFLTYQIGHVSSFFGHGIKIYLLSITNFSDVVGVPHRNAFIHYHIYRPDAGQELLHPGFQFVGNDKVVYCNGICGGFEFKRIIFQN